MNILSKYLRPLLLSLSFVVISSCGADNTSSNHTKNNSENSKSIKQVATQEDKKTHLVQEMTAEQLLNIVNTKDSKYQIIDVRSPNEFKSGHIENAINIPHGSILNDETILERFADKELVFYCVSGYRAGLVTDMLTKPNYKAIHHLTGDILGWDSKKYPLKR